MSTSLIDVPVGSWLEIATDRALIKVDTAGDGVCYVSHDQDEATARVFPSKDKISQQISQKDSVATYAKATGEGWKLAVSPKGGGRLVSINR